MMQPSATDDAAATPESGPLLPSVHDPLANSRMARHLRPTMMRFLYHFKVVLEAHGRQRQAQEWWEYASRMDTYMAGIELELESSASNAEAQERAVAVVHASSARCKRRLEAEEGLEKGAARPRAACAADGQLRTDVRNYANGVAAEKPWMSDEDRAFLLERLKSLAEPKHQTAVLQRVRDQELQPRDVQAFLERLCAQQELVGCTGKCALDQLWSPKVRASIQAAIESYSPDLQPEHFDGPLVAYLNMAFTEEEQLDIVQEVVRRDPRQARKVPAWITSICNQKEAIKNQLGGQPQQQEGAQAVEPYNPFALA